MKKTIKFYDDIENALSSEYNPEIEALDGYYDGIEEFLLSRCVSGFKGVVIGDALGGPVQFKNRGTFSKITKMEPIIHNQLSFKKGTYSDDTALMFATVQGLFDSIIEYPKYPTDSEVINYEYVMEYFERWLLNGDFTQDGFSWDIGRTVRKSIHNHLKYGYSAIESGERAVDSNGNGALMRFFPVPCYLATFVISKLLYAIIDTDHTESNGGYGGYELFAGKEICAMNESKARKIISNYIFNKIFDVSHKMASLTHAHIINLIACDIYTVFILMILAGVKKENLINKTWDFILEYAKTNKQYESNLPIFDRIFSKNFKNTSSYEISSSGYVVDTLEAALWSFLSTDSFDECLIKAINLGDDADSVGAVAGGIAGCYYNSINESWFKDLRNRNNVISDNISLFSKYMSFLISKFQGFYDDIDSILETK